MKLPVRKNSESDGQLANRDGIVANRNDIYGFSRVDVIYMMGLVDLTAYLQKSTIYYVD